MSTQVVKLQRSDPSQPWGFRIHGGVDFNQPLLILKVTAGSLSAQQGLVPGDQIILINGEDALRLRHREAQQKIISAGNQVEFQVLRGDSANLEKVLISSEGIKISRQGSVKQSNRNSTIISSTSSSSYSHKSSSSSTVSSTSVQQSGVAPAVTQGWRGPKYTEENIKEMLTSQAQVLDTGAIGVNFMKNDEKDLDMKKSEVLKMLHELEEEKKMKAQIQASRVNAGDAEGAAQLQFQPSVSSFGLFMNRAYESALQAQQAQAPWASPQHSPAPAAQQ